MKVKGVGKKVVKEMEYKHICGEEITLMSTDFSISNCQENWYTNKKYWSFFCPTCGKEFFIKEEELPQGFKTNC
jgi:predicted RNA-binding Zn-ribbon protein involved in translation (DUF1610 family)